MIWIKFAFSAALIVLTATQLAKYGDVIAVRTRLGGMFVGVLSNGRGNVASGITHFI